MNYAPVSLPANHDLRWNYFDTNVPFALAHQDTRLTSKVSRSIFSGARRSLLRTISAVTGGRLVVLRHRRPLAQPYRGSATIAAPAVSPSLTVEFQRLLVAPPGAPKPST